MQALQNLDSASLLDTFVSLATAFVLGGLIGFERQYRQRTAGLRTNVLVAVGAAVFVDMADRLDGHAGAVHVAAYVVSGIGFLGAGAIMREEGNVRGLNTAATLWGSAAVGAAAGADLIAEAFVASLFVLAANTLLRPVVNAINRKPMNHDLVEATNSIHLIAERTRQKSIMEDLEEELERSHHPVRDLSIKQFSDEEIAIEVILAATSVDATELDQVVERLAALQGVSQAYWNASAGE